MRLKREIARFRVKYRRAVEQRAATKERRLMLQRNKALKEAEQAARRAKLIEDKRQAEAKRMAAKERLRIARGKGRKGHRGTAIKAARGTAKTLGGIVKGLQKWSRSRGY